MATKWLCVYIGLIILTNKLLFSFVRVLILVHENNTDTYHLSSSSAVIQLSKTSPKILETRHELLLVLRIADPVKVILHLYKKSQDI